MRDITDNEIIEFVKYAMYSAKGEDGFKEIYWERFKDILDLIKRQKAEIERLRKDNEYILMQHKFDRRPNGDCLNDVIEKAKSEAIKGFAEELKNCFCVSKEYLDIMNIIDNLVKEMEGK